MATFQQKRGVTAKVQAYIPLAGELVVDTTLNKLYLGDGTTAGGIAVGGTDGGAALTAQRLATPRTIAGVSFDGSANISISAANVGALASGATAVAANKLATARAIGLTGAVTGTANFDGTAAVSITTILADIDLGVLP